MSSFRERSLEVGEKLECIAAYFEDIVEKGQKSTNGKDTGEHADEAELNKHLQVVVSGIVILQNDKI